MIEINLLPKELRKKEVRFEIPLDSLLKILVIVLLIHLSLTVTTAVRKAKLDSLNKNFFEFQEKKIAYDDLKKEIEILEKNRSNLDQLKGKRIIWSEKLNFISDTIPKGIWLKELSFSKGKFKIIGSCVSKRSDETERIQIFLSRLREEFKDLELKGLTRRSIKSQDVIDFILSSEQIDIPD